jgi:uncharacterized protein (UPF0262 family)
MGEHRLKSVVIDRDSLASLSPDIEHEREVAIVDLLERNTFRPEGAAAGPYDLRLLCMDNRLGLEISGPDYSRTQVLSLTPFRGHIRDYQMICASYYDALRDASPTQIEAIDMGRRGIHNDAAELLRERLKGKVETDLDTARRLFTLIYALRWRAGA